MIEVNNLTKRKINSKILKKLAIIILKNEKKELNISVAFVRPEEIKELNKKYRRKNKPTDVLSFLYKEGESGEIVICPSQIKMGLDRTLIHGILHLLGYSHGKKMIEKEEYYLDIHA